MKNLKIKEIPSWVKSLAVVLLIWIIGISIHLVMLEAYYKSGWGGGWGDVSLYLSSLIFIFLPATVLSLIILVKTIIKYVKQRREGITQFNLRYFISTIVLVLGAFFIMYLIHYMFPVTFGVDAKSCSMRVPYKEPCFVNLAVKKGDLQICDLVSYSRTYVTSCYTKIAIKKKDITICDRIKDSGSFQQYLGGGSHRMTTNKELCYERFQEALRR